MADVVVTPVRSFWQRRRFLKFPWTIYRNDPYWVPPLLVQQKELLGWRRHPFYDRSQSQSFLAERDGKTVGRITAIVNDAHNQHYKERRGFFGFFESIDDQQVANALFDAARDWLFARGMNCLRGPASPNLMNECGLLVEGFDSSPYFMMSYNPPYYAQLIENWGFRKSQDLLAYVGYIKQLPGINDKLTPMMESARERLGATVRPVDPRNLRKELETFLLLWNESLVAMWGFVPVRPDEVSYIASRMKHLLVPEFAIAGLVDDRVVGCVIALPDYNVALKKMNGRLFPFGFLRLLRERRRSKRLRLVTINVLPEFQRWGLGLVLMNALVPKAVELQVEECEFSWVAESNDLSRKGLEKGGAIRYKTYRMYDFPALAAPAAS